MPEIKLKNGTAVEWVPTHMIGEVPVMQLRTANRAPLYVDGAGKFHVANQKLGKPLEEIHLYTEKKAGTIRLTLEEMALLYKGFFDGRTEDRRRIVIRQDDGKTVLYARPEGTMGEEVRRIITLPEYIELPAERDVWPEAPPARETEEEEEVIPPAEFEPARSKGPTE